MTAIRKFDGRARRVREVKIDGEALRNVIYANYKTLRSFCDKWYLAESTVSSSLKNGNMPEGMFTVICMALELNPDEFLSKRTKTPTEPPKEEPATNGRFDAHIAKLEELRKVNVDNGLMSVQIRDLLRELIGEVKDLKAEVAANKTATQYMSKRMTEQTEKIYNVVKYHSPAKASS